MKALWHSSVFRRTALVLLAALLLGIVVVGQAALPAQAQTTNLAQGRPVTCSSVENAAFPCANAVDGSSGTRWSSAFSDPQWITVDLGAAYSISRVVLNWEAAYGRSYQIQVAGSASGPWTSVYSTTSGNGGTDDLAVSGWGRYVRMYGTARATQWGYSLFEFQVYGGGTPPPTTPPPVTGTPWPLSVSPLPEHTCEQEIDVSGSTGLYSNVSVRVYDLNSTESQSFFEFTNSVSFNIPVALYPETQNGIVVVSSGDSPPFSSATVSYEQHPELIVDTTGCGVTSTPPPTTPPPSNLALGKQAVCSSTENAGTPCPALVDGNMSTRWSSAFSDPQWAYVDLGATYSISRVVLYWEAAYGRSYQIQVAGSASGPWTSVYSTTSGNGGTDDLAVSGSGRYVRMYGTARATNWGYSLWEFQVFGGGTPPPTTPPPPPTTPPPTTQPGQAPYGGTPRAVPGTIQAEDYDTGGEGVAYHDTTSGNSGGAYRSDNVDIQATSDTGGGNNIGWTANGEWLEYTINATTSGTYTLSARVAAPSVGATIHAEIDSNNVTGAMSVPATGAWQTWTTVTSGSFSLSAGQHVLRVAIDTAGLNLNWVSLQTGTTPPPTTPPPTTPPPTDTSFWGDTTNIPAASNVLMFKFINRTNGQYADNQIYWSFNGQTHSIAEQPYFDMPANSAGRMYFYLGSPNSQYSDFIEFTIGPTVFNGNTTRVDWFGIKLAMRLRCDDGYDVAVGEDLATFQEDRAATFQKFINEVPAEFKHLAQAPFAPYRIPAPAKMGDTAFAPGGQYANYFTSYAASVGVSASTSEIFGCAGPLAGNPSMCAALNRHTAHLPSSSWENSSLFYSSAPANYYAKFWHDHSLQAMAYGFPYDDVGGYSSFIAHGNPTWLIVAIGW